MNREEKCKIAIEQGFNYNPETGQIFGIKGKELTSKSMGYIQFKFIVNEKKYSLLGHQFAWYWVNNEIVDYLDHIDLNRSNNKINNLRSVTKQENSFNRKQTKGYHFDTNRGKWKAEITINYKKKHLGYFDSEQDAHNAYLKAKKLYHII